MKKKKKVSKVDKKKILKKKTVKKKTKVVKKKTVVKKTPKKKQVKKVVKKKVEAKKFVEPKLPPQSDKKVNNRIINPAHYQAKKVKKFLYKALAKTPYNLKRTQVNAIYDNGEQTELEYSQEGKIADIAYKIVIE